MNVVFFSRSPIFCSEDILNNNERVLEWLTKKSVPIEMNKNQNVVYRNNYIY